MQCTWPIRPPCILRAGWRYLGVSRSNYRVIGAAPAARQMPNTSCCNDTWQERDCGGGPMETSEAAQQSMQCSMAWRSGASPGEARDVVVGNAAQFEARRAIVGGVCDRLEPDETTKRL